MVFRPRLADCLAQYQSRDFAADLGAGIPVGIVALLLPMAFGIASGVDPKAGLDTAIARARQLLLNPDPGPHQHA
jgi:SulP family sulfate permease